MYKEQHFRSALRKLQWALPMWNWASEHFFKQIFFGFSALFLSWRFFNFFSHLTFFCMVWLYVHKLICFVYSINHNRGSFRKHEKKQQHCKSHCGSTETFIYMRKDDTHTYFLWKHSPYHKPFHWADTGLWALILQPYVFIDGTYKKGLRGIMKKGEKNLYKIFFFSISSRMFPASWVLPVLTFLNSQ